MRKIWGGDGVGGLGVNDALMKDARLSAAARGLAVHLLLLPEAATPDLARFAARPGESEATIEGYLRELETAGYLRRRRLAGDGGRAYEEATVYAQAAAPDELPGRMGRVFRWSVPAGPRARNAG